MTDKNNGTDRVAAGEETHFRQLISDSADSRLPVPWGGQAKYRETGKRTSTHTEPLLSFTGDWDCLHETEAGLPAVFSNGDYGFAGSLNIPSHPWAYSAYVGVFPDGEQVRTVAIVPCHLGRASKYVGVRQGFRLGDDEDLVQRIISDPWPFFVSNREQYLCFGSEASNPSIVLDELQITGFAELKNRIKILTDALEVRFHAKAERSNRSIGDSERGKELNDMIREEFDFE
jgi:uncharacterized small protein (DUF1192 family)